MTQFQTAPTIPLKTGTDGKDYIDYKSVDDLRRLMTPNGKIYTRKRLGASAREQRRVARALQHAALAPHFRELLSRRVVRLGAAEPAGESLEEELEAREELGIPLVDVVFGVGVLVHEQRVRAR